MDDKEIALSERPFNINRSAQKKLLTQQHLITKTTSDKLDHNQLTWPYAPAPMRRNLFQCFGQPCSERKQNNK